MHIIFIIFFFILIFALVIILSIVVRLLSIGRKLTNLFRKGGNSDRDYNQHGKTNNGRNGFFNKKKEKPKVFSDDEGEYVNYEEVN